MTSKKLEEAAKKAAYEELGVIRVPIVYGEFVSPLEEYEDRRSRKIAAYEAVFKAGVEWLATELRTLAFPNNTEDQVIRLSDLEKIVGEE